MIEFFPDFMMDSCCRIFEEPMTMLASFDLLNIGSIFNTRLLCIVT